MRGAKGFERQASVHFFPLHIGIHDSISVELLVIQKACELCASKPALADHIIHVVSDSKVAVNWANTSDGLGSFNHVSIIYDIRGFVSQLRRLKIVHNNRTLNSFANSLAKRGSSGMGERIDWEI